MCGSNEHAQRRSRRQLTRSVVGGLIAGLLITVAPALIGFPSAAPYAWQLRAAVIASEEPTVRVRHKSGQIVPVTVDAQTVYVKDKRPASLTALTVGMRVTIDLESQAAVNRTVRVQTFGAGTSALGERRSVSRFLLAEHVMFLSHLVRLAVRLGGE